MKSKKYMFRCLMLTLCTLITGCQSITEKPVGVLDVILSDKASSYGILPEKTMLKAPSDILVLEDRLVVVDRELHGLVFLDHEGNYIETVGALGIGPLEFQKPTAVAYANNKFFIVDAGNNRIQVIDANDMSYISEISLPTYAHFVFTDIAIGADETIYAVSDNFVTDWACIYRANLGDEMVAKVKWKKSFLGRLDDSAGTVYALQSVECKEEKDKYVSQSGENALFTVTGDTVSKILELPYSYTPDAYVMDEERLTVFSCRWQRIDTFTLESTYIETLLSLDPMGQHMSGEWSMAQAANGTLYLANYTNPSITVIQPGGADAL